VRGVERQGWGLVLVTNNIAEVARVLAPELENWVTDLA
jgi:hypothetical protein